MSAVGAFLSLVMHKANRLSPLVYYFSRRCLPFFQVNKTSHLFLHILKARPRFTRPIRKMVVACLNLNIRFEAVVSFACYALW